MTDKKQDTNTDVSKDKEDKKDKVEGYPYNLPYDDDWYREQQRERIMEEDKGDHWIWE